VGTNVLLEMSPYDLDRARISRIEPSPPSRQARV
jgi:translation initiation factor IF-1